MGEQREANEEQQYFVNLSPAAVDRARAAPVAAPITMDAPVRGGLPPKTTNSPTATGYSATTKFCTEVRAPRGAHAAALLFFVLVGAPSNRITVRH